MRKGRKRRDTSALKVATNLCKFPKAESPIGKIRLLLTTPPSSCTCISAEMSEVENTTTKRSSLTSRLSW